MILAGCRPPASPHPSPGKSPTPITPQLTRTQQSSTPVPKPTLFTTPSPAAPASPTASPSLTQTPSPLPQGISPGNATRLSQAAQLHFASWELVSALAWAPQGNLLAVSAGENLYLLDFPSLEKRAAADLGALSPALVFSPDGRWLAAGSRDGLVRLWDLGSGTDLAVPDLTLEAHKKGVNCLAFLQSQPGNLAGTAAPGSLILASGGNDALARLWDPESGRRLSQIIGGTFAVPSLAFDPRRGSLAVISGQVVRLRDAQDGRMLGTLRVESAPLFSLAFSPDGRFMAAGDHENTVWLWDAEEASFGKPGGAPPRELRPQPGEAASGVLVWEVAFNPQGDLLASAGTDGVVRLWDTVSARLLASLPGSSAAVTSLAFSPDGLWLAEGGLDGVLRLWFALDQG